jgi:hypothetical protein
MSWNVERGSVCQCEFGTAPSPLLSSGHLLTVRDFVPFLNIQPFGACTCAANPTVAQVSAAGPIVPQACVPSIEQPWSTPAQRLVANGQLILRNDSTVRCRWGGVIRVTQARSQ